MGDIAHHPWLQAPARFTAGAKFKVRLPVAGPWILQED
jgi:hypothetical protein